MGKQKNILKLDEAAKYLGVSIDDVKDLVSNGDLPAIGSQKTMIKRCVYWQSCIKWGNPAKCT